MATASVTLKLTPNELQVVAESLRLYASAMNGLGRTDREHPLDGYQFDLSLTDGDSRKAAMLANGIRQNIGLH